MRNSSRIMYSTDYLDMAATPEKTDCMDNINGGAVGRGVIVDYNIPSLDRDAVDKRIAATKEGGATAVYARLGTFRYIREKITNAGTILVATTAPVSHTPDLLELEPAVLDAKVEGADAIAIEYYPASEHAATQREQFRTLRTTALEQEAELPLFVSIHSGGLEDYVPERVREVRSAVERGADAIIIDAIDGIDEIVNASLAVPVYIRIHNVGPKTALKQARDANAANAHGVVIGRLTMDEGVGQQTLAGMIKDINNIVNPTGGFHR